MIKSNKQVDTTDPFNKWVMLWLRNLDPFNKHVSWILISQHDMNPTHEHELPPLEVDQEKISFITSQGLFCYKVMSFRLKNAGATYQRLVNHMFHPQIGWNLEVYMDDMLVKSLDEKKHLDNL